MVMLWSRVGESDDCSDDGQGSLPSPETSMAIWRVSGIVDVSSIDDLMS